MTPHTQPDRGTAALPEEEEEAQHEEVNEDDENDETGIDPALAAAMGFTSFGAQSNPNKKRKIASSASANPATGANAEIPVTPQRKPRTVPKQSAEVEAEAEAFESPYGTFTAHAAASSASSSSRPHSSHRQEHHHRKNDLANLQSGGPMTGLPARPPPPPITSQQYGDEQDVALYAFANGVPVGEFGDIAYFLPSFVEDPWAPLR